MKISTRFSFSMICLPAANAWQEFGRRTYTDEKPILKRKQVPGFEPVNKVRAEQDFDLATLSLFEEVLDSDVEVMSFSMSMSFSYDGSSSASRPPATSFPTAVPTLPPSSSSSMPSEIPSESPSENPSEIPSENPSEIPSDMPSLVPSSGPTITSEPTDVPTISPAPSASSAPSSSAEPTDAPSSSPVNSNTPSPTVFDNEIFQCDGNTVVLGEPSESTVSVFLTVGYLVESTSNNTDDFVGVLENALFETAVLAALGCQDFLMENRPKLLADTTIVDICDPDVPEAVSCHSMETYVKFWVNGEIGTEEAAYRGYTAIRDNMGDDGSFLTLTDVLVRLEYLSPYPLPTPPAANGGDNSGTTATPPSSVASRGSGGDNNVSPWTIGACVATIMGGLISMVVWSRNRGNRRQHVQLFEDDEQEDPIFRGASWNAVSI